MKRVEDKLEKIEKKLRNMNKHISKNISEELTKVIIKIGEIIEKYPRIVVVMSFIGIVISGIPIVLTYSFKVLPPMPTIILCLVFSILLFILLYALENL